MHNLVCVECLQTIKSMVVGFCFIGIWCYSEWWVWDLICTVSRMWNAPRVIPKLYGWVYKTLRFSPLVVEHSVVMIVRDWVICVANFWFPFYEICVQDRWWHKLLRLSWGLRHWWSKFNYCKDGILTCFSVMIFWTDEGDAETIVF